MKFRQNILILVYYIKFVVTDLCEVRSGRV